MKGPTFSLFWAYLTSKVVNVSATLPFSVCWVSCKLFSTFTKPFRTSLEIFKAKSAVRTRYIIPIIF